MSTIVRLITRAHALLLRSYPYSFRAEFAEEMQAVFAEAAEAAKGDLRSLLTLCFREVWDWPSSLVRAYWFAFWHKERMMNGTQGHTPAAPTWTTVGLMVLPGLLVFGSSWVVSARDTVPLWGLAICVTLGTAGLIRTRHIPFWSYTTLGIALSLLLQPAWILGVFLIPIAILAIVLWLRRQKVNLPKITWGLIALMVIIGLARPAVLSVFPRHHFSLNWWDLGGDGALLLVVAIGLLLARRGGIMASLLVIAAGFVLFEQVLDFTYGLWKTPWGTVMLAMLASWLLIIAPFWVTRSRTARGRMVGVLLPTAVALSFVVTINAIVRTQPAVLDELLNIAAWVPASAPPWIGVGTREAAELWPLLVGGGMTAAQLFLGVALSVVLYGRFGSEKAPVQIAQCFSASGSPAGRGCETGSGDSAFSHTRLIRKPTSMINAPL